VAVFAPSVFLCAFARTKVEPSEFHARAQRGSEGAKAIQTSEGRTHLTSSRGSPFNVTRASVLESSALSFLLVKPV
jgi:hypothetical protein